MTWFSISFASHYIFLFLNICIDDSKIVVVRKWNANIFIVHPENSHPFKDSKIERVNNSLNIILILLFLLALPSASLFWCRFIFYTIRKYDRSPLNMQFVRSFDLKVCMVWFTAIIRQAIAKFIYPDIFILRKSYRPIGNRKNFTAFLDIRLHKSQQTRTKLIPIGRKLRFTYPTFYKYCTQRNLKNLC